MPAALSLQGSSRTLAPSQAQRLPSGGHGSRWPGTYRADWALYKGLSDMVHRRQEHPKALPPVAELTRYPLRWQPQGEECEDKDKNTGERRTPKAARGPLQQKALIGSAQLWVWQQCH